MFASPGGRNSGPSLGRSLFLGAYGTHESTHRGPTFTAARGYPKCTELGGLTLPRCRVRRGGAGEGTQVIPSFGPNNKDKPDRLLDGDSLPGSTQARGKELHN